MSLPENYNHVEYYPHVRIKKHLKYHNERPIKSIIEIGILYFGNHTTLLLNKHWEKKTLWHFSPQNSYYFAFNNAMRSCGLQINDIIAFQYSGIVLKSMC